MTAFTGLVCGLAWLAVSSKTGEILFKAFLHINGGKFSNGYIPTVSSLVEDIF